LGVYFGEKGAPLTEFVLPFIRANEKGVHRPTEQFLSFDESIEKIGIGHIIADHNQIDVASGGLLAFGHRAVYECCFDAAGMGRERIAQSYDRWAHYINVTEK
jgi:hypothetical protein